MSYFEIGIMECPYNIRELKSSNRSHDLVNWRHVLMYLASKEGNTLTRSAEMLNRHHASAIHAIKKVNNAIEGYDDDLLTILNVITRGQSVHRSSKHSAPVDVCQAELVGLAVLENNLNR